MKYLCGHIETSEIEDLEQIWAGDSNMGADKLQLWIQKLGKVEKRASNGILKCTNLQNDSEIEEREWKVKKKSLAMTISAKKQTGQRPKYDRTVEQNIQKKQ